MLSGLVARTSGADSSSGQALLNDASLYLQALERGWVVLTRNVRHFDFFDQLLPADRLLLYEQA